jgi:hypothetical protein
MPAMLKFCKENKLLAVLLLMALAGRLWFECACIDFNMDKARQLVIAQNFSAGEGFTLRTADPRDLADTISLRIPWWPIGYPFLMSSLNVLFHDYILSSIVLDLLGVLVLFKSFFTFFRVLDLGRRPFILFLIFTAFSFAPYFYLGSTDFLSAALYLLALSMALDRPGAARCVTLGAAVFVAAFLRYAYYPFTVIIPIFLFVNGKRREALVTFLSTALPLAALLAFYQYYFGSPFYVKGVDAFFPEHLLHMDPFPLRSFFLLELAEKNLPASMLYLVRPAAWIVSLVLLGMLAVNYLQGVNRKFLSLLFMTVGLNVAMLSYYSLKNPPQSGWIDWWTYVQETRYYAPSMLLIQVGLFAAALQAKGSRVVRYGAICFVAVITLFSMLFGFHRIFEADEPTFFEDLEQEVAAALSVIEGLDGDVVYADGTAIDGVSIHDTCLVALGTRARIVLDYPRLISGPLNSSKPVILVLNMPLGRSEREEALIAEHAATCLHENGRAALYRFNLGPRGGR